MMILMAPFSFDKCVFTVFSRFFFDFIADFVQKLRTRANNKPQNRHAQRISLWLTRRGAPTHRLVEK